MAFTALQAFAETFQLGGEKEGDVNFGPTAVTVTKTTIATFDVRDYDELSLILKNTDAADTLTFDVEGAVKQVPDDGTDIDWATLTEKGEATEIAAVALAFGVKEFLHFETRDVTYVRVRAVRSGAADAEMTGSAKAMRKRQQ